MHIKLIPLYHKNHRYTSKQICLQICNLTDSENSCREKVVLGSQIAL